jgi:hypothetical protein
VSGRDDDPTRPVRGGEDATRPIARGETEATRRVRGDETDATRRVRGDEDPTRWVDAAEPATRRVPAAPPPVRARRLEPLPPEPARYADDRRVGEDPRRQGHPAPPPPGRDAGRARRGPPPPPLPPAAPRGRPPGRGRAPAPPAPRRRRPRPLRFLARLVALLLVLAIGAAALVVATADEPRRAVERGRDAVRDTVDRARGVARGVPAASCPGDLSGCRAVRGRIVFVEAVDPDGDGDLHVVIADGSVTAPGLTSVDVRPGLRPERDPRVGEQASAAGQVQRGSFDQQQIHAVEFHAAGG